MEKRMENRLDAMIDWLTKDSVNYSKKDFKEDVDRMLSAADEALWCQILTDKEYDNIKAIITRKAIKYL